MSRRVQDMHRAGLDFHYEQHVLALRQQAISVQEVTGQDARDLDGEELPPGRRRPPRSRAEPGSGQGTADRSLPHPVPQAGQLALNARVFPAQVLPRHLLRSEPGSPDSPRDESLAVSPLQQISDGLGRHVRRIPQALAALTRNGRIDGNGRFKRPVVVSRLGPPARRVGKNVGKVRQTDNRPTRLECRPGLAERVRIGHGPQQPGRTSLIGVLRRVNQQRSAVGRLLPAILYVFACVNHCPGPRLAYRQRLQRGEYHRHHRPVWPPGTVQRLAIVIARAPRFAPPSPGNPDATAAPSSG